jgi:hypothetical protein
MAGFASPKGWYLPVRRFVILLPERCIRMSDERYERGRKKLPEMSGRDVEAMTGNQKDISPDPGLYTAGFTYEDILNRPGLYSGHAGPETGKTAVQSPKNLNTLLS